ncbi:MAG: NAD-dependent epimerase/dehydratase family protein [Candidatus Falkowbacteria bacterium]
MPKVLITGGAGFIGSAIAKNLSERGFAIKSFDINKPKERFGEYINSTIMYPDELYQSIKGCDYVIHLAAMLGVKRTEQSRMACLNINIQGTKNVIDACVRAGVKKILFSSSSEVYGEPYKTPICEDDPVSPKSIYAITKLAGEEYLKAYQREHGLDYSIIRFFNVYGAGQVEEFVMSRFVRAVTKDQAPTVYGEGNQVRSFCHVSDAAQGVYLALVSDKSNAEVFNIGNDQAAITMKDLAHKVIALSGKNIEPCFVPMEQSDRTSKREIIKRMPDISKAKALLNYNPTITLDEGITDIIEKWKNEKMRNSFSGSN